MGRPINRQMFLGNVAPHQIQATVWGTNDTGSTPGYLTKQNSPRRFRAHTVNGNSLTQFVNGSGNLVQGTSFVKVFPVGTLPTTPATANATLGAIGNANVVVGGHGYQPGDFINFVGGTAVSAANVQVLAVNSAANNAIVTLSKPLQTLGQQQYSVLPANISAIATSTANGVGTGAIVSSNFGLDKSSVITGGAGYTTAVVVYEPSVNAPTITQPTVSGGAVTTGPVTITAQGLFLVVPTATVEEQTGTTEYLSYLQSMNFLETFQGHRYRWLYKGQAIPSDWASLNVSIAYLDTK